MKDLQYCTCTCYPRLGRYLHETYPLMTMVTHYLIYLINQVSPSIHGYIPMNASTTSVTITLHKCHGNNSVADNNSTYSNEISNNSAKNNDDNNTYRQNDDDGDIDNGDVDDDCKYSDYSYIFCRNDTGNNGNNRQICKKKGREVRYKKLNDVI